MSAVSSLPDALSRIEELLREEIGLDPATVGRSLIQRAAQRRMRALAVADLDRYAGLLANGTQELQELVEEVVVPETYFFREPDAIRDVVRRIAEGAPSHGAHAELRILSVPCSTGEEPYSIAMSLLSHGISSDRVRIDAVDVSLEAVRRAREAVFRGGSFRGEQGAWLEYFSETARGRELLPAVRAFVSVEHGNLMSASFQPPSERYDVIFCRNLLIYFDEHTQARALGALTRLLSTNGVLVVGAADTFAVRRAGFEPLKGAERSFLFQLRGETAPDARSVPAAQSASAPPVRARARAIRPITPRATLPLRRPAPSPVPSALERESAHSAYDEIARLANEGRLAEVLARGERALHDGAATAPLLALMGTTYAAVENENRAEECYRQALFLDPANEDALLHLALLLDERCAGALGNRLRARARRGLSFRQADAR